MCSPRILAIFYSCTVAGICLVDGFAPYSENTVVSSSKIHTTKAIRPRTSLRVTVGLGPGAEEKKKEGRHDSILMTPNIKVELVEEPDHELYRKSRMTDFDYKCDAWYGALLTGEGSFLGEVSANALRRITTPCELTKVLPIPQSSDDWDPYQMAKLPGSIVYPAYGLETYGLPIPRRKAECWKTFDVPGLVAADYSETQKGIGTDVILDEEIQTRYKEHFIEKGIWLDDDECAGRLVYINGRFAPSMSILTDIATNLGPDYFSSDEVTDEVIDQLNRLPDGFTDRLAADVPHETYTPGKDTTPLTHFKDLSGPYHALGPAELQYAINGQQGTACFAALNSLKAGAVSYINIPASTIETKPVLVINGVSADGGVGSDIEEGKGVASHPRCLVNAEDGAALSVVQAFVDLDEPNAENSVQRLVNSFTQMYIGAEANVTHSYLEETGGIATGGVETTAKDLAEGDELPSVIEKRRKETKNTHFETIEVHVTGEKGRYEGTAIGIGGNGRARVSVSSTLLGPNSHGAINGFSLAGGTQRADFRSFIHHVGQGSTSCQAQKNMIGGRSTVSFRGRIRVEQNSQQTDVQQLTRNILLSDRSKVWVIPSLEIIADDVMCTHGATISDLSTEELYYLRTRGISKGAARNLLMYAFVDEVTSAVDDSMQGEKMAQNSLKNRVIRRLQNLVPRGDRAFRGEYQSV